MSMMSMSMMTTLSSSPVPVPTTANDYSKDNVPSITPFVISSSDYPSLIVKPSDATPTLSPEDNIHSLSSRLQPAQKIPPLPSFLPISILMPSLSHDSVTSIIPSTLESTSKNEVAADSLTSSSYQNSIQKRNNNTMSPIITSLITIIVGTIVMIGLIFIIRHKIMKRRISNNFYTGVSVDFTASSSLSAHDDDDNTIYSCWSV